MSFFRAVTIAMTTATLLAAGPAQASRFRLDFTGLVTEVIEDPGGTIEFPGVAAGDSIDGAFHFTSATDFSFHAELGPTSVGANGTLADLEVTDTLVDGFAGNDELQVLLTLADPGAQFLDGRGTPLDVSGFATNSLRFTEGAFDGVVVGRFSTVTISPVPEPGAALLFAAGAAVVAARVRRYA